MKPLLRRLVYSILALLALAIIVRAAWVASRTDGGWQIMRDHVVAGMPPLFSKADGSGRAILLNRWQPLLDEADRLASDPHATAGDCMAAAWLLTGFSAFKNESPDPFIVGRIVWARPPRAPRSEDWQEMYEATASRSRQLAARATELEPERVDWWRARALLMIWPLDRGQFDTGALNTALRHDRDNALYDYLLAAAAMNEAFADGQTLEGPTRYIANEALFEEGKQLYQRAASKKLLACGEKSFSETARFLAGLDAPLQLKLAWANTAAFELATFKLIQRLGSPLDEFNSRELSSAESNALLSWFSDHSTWPEQIVIVPKTLWLQDRLTSSNGSWGPNYHIEKLLEAENRRDQLSKSFSILAVEMAALAWTCYLLAAIGCAAIATVARHRKSRSLASHIGRDILVLAGVITVTFVCLGLVPAYELELQRVHWAIGATVIGFIIAAIGYLVWRLSRFVWTQSRLSKHDRSSFIQPARWALVVIASLLFLIALFSLIDFRFREVIVHLFARFPSNLLSDGGTDYATVEALGVVTWKSFGLALLEWGARGGLFWTLGLTMACIVYLQWRCIEPNGPPRDRIVDSLRYIMKTMLWLGILLMLISVACATQSIIDLQSRYRRELGRLSDTGWLAKQAEAESNNLKLSLPLQPSR